MAYFVELFVGFLKAFDQLVEQNTNDVVVLKLFDHQVSYSPLYVNMESFDAAVDY